MTFVFLNFNIFINKMSYKTLKALFDESEYYKEKTPKYQGPLIFENDPNIATAVDKGYSNPSNETVKTCKGNLDHHLNIAGVT